MKQDASVQECSSQTFAGRLREQKRWPVKNLGVTEEAKLCLFVDEYIKLLHYEKTD